MARRGHTNVDSMQDESPLGLQSSFIAGLKTEFTGLNFPPNAATDTDNCVFTMLGDVTRRKGFDYELNYELASLGDRTGAVLNTYLWRNAGGDGESILFVAQVATKLYFYVVTDMTSTSPLSAHKLSSTVDLTQFVVLGSPRDVECQFADGNGYLFVYNNACDPFYCTYDPIAKTVSSAVIKLKTRDFLGIPETGVETTNRSQTLTSEHEYNLRNQGWTRAPLWNFTATGDNQNSYLMGNAPGTEIPTSFTGNGHVGISIAYGNHTWTVTPGLPITIGTPIDINFSMLMNIYDIDATTWHAGTETGTAKGVVTQYDSATGNIVVNVTYTNPQLHSSNLEYNITLGPIVYEVRSSDSINTIDTWFKQIGSYPANADIWWIFKDETDTFNPSATIGNKGLPSAWAPKGHYILDAFDLDPAAAANTAAQFGNVISGLTPIATSKRPRLGTFFQGRVWYTGVDDSQQKTGDQNFYTWTENIYFSRIIESIDDFGKCHEDNDPTDQYSFNLLPSDGGVITIQGAGAVYKLFPIQNGMLVFAANGIWFITGSQGIGFSASDYTITKISGVRSISTNSYVDVNGLPIFWNEEGIYTVAPAQQGLGLTVNPLTVGTIKSFYNKISLSAKKQARGSYNPIDYVVQWVYNDVATAGATGYTIYLFDDSCHLFTSLDSGATFFENTTINGDWSDMVIAVNDNDFKTLGLVEENNHNCALVIEKDYTELSITQPLTTPILSDDQSVQEFWSVAMSGGGNTILVPITNWDFFENLDTNVYPRLSRDRGVTWSDVTSLPANRAWTRACFGHSATTMYIHHLDSSFGIVNGNFGMENYSEGLWKSTNSGVTWTQVTSFPGIQGTGAAYEATAHSQVGKNENSMRMRCSADGQIIGIMTCKGDFVLSTNGGRTWSVTNFVTKAGGAAQRLNACDFGWDTTNTTIVTSIANDTGSFTSAWISNDIGTTWTQLTPPSVNGSRAILNINIAQDALGLVVVYRDNTTTGLIDVSVDGGQTWETKTFSLATLDQGITGYFTSSYILSNTPAHFVQAPDLLTDLSVSNRVLNFNTNTQAFYPWTVSSLALNGVTTPRVHAVDYVQAPGGTDDPPAIFKYFSSVKNSDGTYSYTFSEATDPTYVDWDYATETTGDVYNSYFVTGYSLFGQGLRKFQPMYVQMFSRLNEENMKYSIQGLWDFATAGNSGKWSTRQVVSLDKPNFGMAFKRHKVRGNGYALQLKISSVDDSPFDIMGWNMQVTQNAGM